MQIKKRQFLKLSAAAAATGFSGLLSKANAREGQLDIFFNSDTNIIDFWTQYVKPGFEAAHSGVTLNLIPGGGGGSMHAIADRAFAAFKAKKDPQVDMLEAVSPEYPVGSIKAGLWVDFKTAGLKNYHNINPVLVQQPQLLPYRGSQVVLMYNSDKVKNVPTTYKELVAWIKQNPGQFTYARPDLGDSGSSFVERSLQEVTGRNPDLFQNDNYSKAYAEPMFKKLWALLNEIAPYLFNKGEYTSGNTASIQLLASGAISMTVAWSDMALTAMREGVVPSSTALAQLQDLAFTGHR